MSMLSLTPPRCLQSVLAHNYMREEVDALIGDNISADVTDFVYIAASNTLVLDIQGTCTSQEIADLYQELISLQEYM